MALLLTGCGAAPAAQPPATVSPTAAPAPVVTPAPEPEPEKLTLDVVLCRYGPKTSEYFLGDGGFAERFERENPDIRLNLEILPWNDVHAAVDERIDGGNVPDILNLDGFSAYVERGLLLPAWAYCPEGLYTDFHPVLAAQSEIDGVAWALPSLASARVLYYNPALLSEAGVSVPASWPELREVCGRLLDYYGGEVYPWGVDMTDDEGQAAFAYYTAANGGGFLDGEGNWALNSPENVTALEFAAELVNAGYTNPNPATQTRYDLQDMFAAGKLAMLIAPNQLPVYVAEKGGDAEAVTAPIPAAAGKTAPAVCVLDRLMVFREDDAPDAEARTDAIRKFLTFFYAPENYGSWVAAEGFLPVTASAAEVLGAADPGLSDWLTLLETGRYYPSNRPDWEQVKRGVIAAEQNALAGGEIGAELDALQAQIAG